ncbi:hypothetical protein PM082_021359 [Marasmius tenuissimus]|nr:hypothetical protein PM082_021359 [Marasmius tenuissimus]
MSTCLCRGSGWTERSSCRIIRRRNLTRKSLFLGLQINLRGGSFSFSLPDVMIIALPVISFLCFALLSLSLLGPRVRNDVPQMSLVVWLVVGNLIHGVNSLVWSGNTDIHIPVWCDIVTKVLLAVAFALPASCFCMAANLELLASKRPLVDTESARRKRLVFTIIICWVAPVIYTLLHFIVQHHRFDIIRDFGCTAAIHSSAASVLVVWLPPFILSIGSFVLCGRSLHHSFRVSASQFEQHIHTRLGMSSSLYLRRMISVLVLTLAVTTISIFTLFARTDFRSFASWEALHIQFTKIFVLGESPDHKLALMMWWLTPVVSIAYVFLWLTVGQDLRDVVKAMKEGEITFPSLPRPRLPRARAILPTHFRKQERAKPSAVHRPRPVAPVLVSGWDEMLDMHSVNSSSRSSPSPPPNKSPCPEPHQGLPAREGT